MQSLRVKFWLQIQGIPSSHLIFIDESGVNLSLVRLFARAPKGKRAHASRPQKRSINISLIGAIALMGVITQYSLIGATDALTFEAFISQKLVPQLWKGADVVMDNCSIHQGKEIEALIEAAGAKLIYLPPYSLDFSPLENCWSKIKSILRCLGAKNYPSLAEAIEKAFNKVCLNNIRSWFTHCCYCTLRDYETLYINRLSSKYLDFNKSLQISTQE